MARILITWELGGGLGHLVRLAPIVRRLTEHGHQVFVAVRDLADVERLFGEFCSGFLQAPVRIAPAADRIEVPRTFAHILHNGGFSSLGQLKAMALAWRNLYEFVRPDLILFDHSPLALLTSRAIGTRRVLLGNGFFCPPDVYPLPDFRSWLPDAAQQLRRDEDRTLAAANGLLAGWGLEPLGQLSQLYREVDANLLATFAELDAYPERQGAEYYGVWSNLGGPGPRWPGSGGTSLSEAKGVGEPAPTARRAGKRIFVYLKAFPALPELLATLGRLGQPTLVHLEPPDQNLQQRYESRWLRFEAGLLDLDKVGAECDLAILHGSHGAVASMLLAGRPLLSLPRHLEQALTARTVERLGAGLTADMNRPDDAVLKLNALLERDHFAAAAGRFATRYADFDPAGQIEHVVARIEGLLG